MIDARSRKIWRGSAALFGAIVGAGIFGLPYFVAQAGYPAGLFWMILLGGAVLLTHLMFVEVIAATKGKHRLVGYVGLHLGRWPKRIETFASVLGAFGGALAYLILGGLFLSQLLPIPPFYGTLAIFAFVSFMVWRGVGFVARIDSLMSFGLAAVFLLLIGKAFTGMRPEFLAEPVVWSRAFLPYGVVLFSFGGLSAIAEVSEMVDNDRASMRKSVIAGTLAASALTALFATAVVGALGKGTSTESVSGLNAAFGGYVPVAAAAAGLLAVATSYVIFSSNLKNQFVDDMRWPSPAAFAVTLGVPIALYLIGIRSFGKVLEIVGSVLVGAEGLFVTWMYLKIKAKAPPGMIKFPNALAYLLMAVFIGGMAYELILKAT